jgi:hypothetical protein
VLERQTGCLPRQINEEEDRPGSMRRAGTAENGPSPVQGAVFGGADAVGNLFGALERQTGCLWRQINEVEDLTGSMRVGAVGNLFGALGLIRTVALTMNSVTSLARARPR